MFQFAADRISPRPTNRTDTELHISIGATPDEEATLEHELALVKAAILYGDKVTLYSFTSYAVLVTRQLENLSIEHQVRFLEGMARYFAANANVANGILEAAAVYRKLRAKRLPTMEEARWIQSFEKQLTAQWQQIAENMAKVSEKNGAAEIFRAMDAGVLETHLFTAPNDTAKMSEEFFQAVEGAVLDHTTYPLLDDGAATLVRERLEQGKFTPSDVVKSRGRNTALASRLIQRLPTFENATVDEVLDIRKELQSSLVRFRGAIIDCSKQLSSAPWDKDFAAEADILYHQKVAPAIVDIEDAIKQSRSLSTILQNILIRPAELQAGSVLALASVALHAPPGVALAAGLVGAVSVAALEAEKTMREKAEAHQMYFYYRVRKSLEKRKKR